MILQKAYCFSDYHFWVTGVLQYCVRLEVSLDQWKIEIVGGLTLGTVSKFWIAKGFKIRSSQNSNTSGTLPTKR
jgi:hypothetical protein